MSLYSRSEPGGPYWGICRTCGGSEEDHQERVMIGDMEVRPCFKWREAAHALAELQEMEDEEDFPWELWEDLAMDVEDNQWEEATRP